MKKWILTAVAMVIIGAVICFAATAAMHFDFEKLDNGKYQTNTYTVYDSFHGISVAASTEQVFFKPAEDEKCTVACFEEENRKHEIAVINGALTIKSIDNRKLADHFGFYNRNTEITVYLPESVYSVLRIDTDTGDINIPADFSFDSIAINGHTSDVTCLASASNGIDIAITTGDIYLKAVMAGSVDLKTTTG